MEKILTFPLNTKQVGIPISSVHQIRDCIFPILHLPDIHPNIDGIAIVNGKSAGIIYLSNIVNEDCKSDCAVEIIYEGEPLIILSPMPLMLDENTDFKTLPLKEEKTVFSGLMEGKGQTIFLIDVRGLYKRLSLI